ncbi:Uncharacterized protein TCM_033512 [Theobroma cacao]|uniref:Uncharacterized protein n=1 Tax=Theobroma cacao TaxID=3641 RepID=A0A061FB38_THECC|nr:Uncharacterized protein TCM_033512 [Theobroma cacao]
MFIVSLFTSRQTPLRIYLNRKSSTSVVHQSTIAHNVTFVVPTPLGSPSMTPMQILPSKVAKMSLEWVISMLDTTCENQPKRS